MNPPLFYEKPNNKIRAMLLVTGCMTFFFIFLGDKIEANAYKAKKKSDK